MASELSAVEEKDGAVVVRANLPGIQPEEVKVEVADGVLTVSGEHDEKLEDEQGGFLRRERRHASFVRSMPVPEGVRAEDVETRVEDGSVLVRVPRAKES
jgi:HSP20 family protein